jgi:hypothetical protein
VPTGSPGWRDGVQAARRAQCGPMREARLRNTVVRDKRATEADDGACRVLPFKVGHPSACLVPHRKGLQSSMGTNLKNMAPSPRSGRRGCWPLPFPQNRCLPRHRFDFAPGNA